VTKTDADLSLESDRLEEKLEAATPAQPVVVIQYRNRGVSSWVFFPLMLVIPLGAILIYHRLVVERYRVQAAVESRQVLEKENGIDAPRSAQSLPGGERPLPPAPSSKPDVPAHGLSGPSGPAPDPAKENPALVAATAQPPRPAESAPADGGRKAEPRLRTILPNPSALVDPPAAPSTRREGTGLADLGGTISTPAGVPSNVPANDRQPANRDGEVVHPALKPLPSKEENLRQFEEEAAKKHAEIVAREQNRETDLRSRRYEERVKFRAELREIVRLQGSDAGPEIDKLAKRYGFDVDPLKYQQALQVWHGRMTLSAKVRLIRSLDLPEIVILDFLSDDQNALRRTPKGPRNKNEVRVRAVRQLLGFELPAADQPPRPDTGAGQRSSPVRTRPLTTPTDGAGPRSR